MPPQKPKEGIQVGKYLITYRAFIVLCLGSYTPFGQAMMSKIGLQNTSSDIEAIKVTITANKAQIDRMDSKLTTLIGEMDKLGKSKSLAAE